MARKNAPKPRPEPERAGVEPGVAWTLVVIGLATSLYFIVLPWLGRHEAGAADGLDMLGVGISPVALGYGVIYLIWGRRAVQVLGLPHWPTALGYVVGFGLMGVGLAIFFLMVYLLA